MKNFFSGKTEFKDPAVNVMCSEPEVNKWSVSEFVVEKLVPVAGMHPFPLDEQMLMTAAVCRFKPELIFEWGTNIGKSARIFYEIITAFKINCQIHSIDLPDDVEHNEHPHRDRGKLVLGKKNVTLHQGDGISCATEILSKNKQASRVLFFVDGDHSYESVKRELTEIIKLFPDAVVLLHDTFYQSADSKYNIGPYTAIQEVLSGTEYKIISTQFGLPGMSMVFKKK